MLMCEGVLPLGGAMNESHESVNHEKWMPSFAYIVTVVTCSLERRHYAQKPCVTCHI